MPTVTDLLSAHPSKDTFDLSELSRCIEACHTCTTACSTCADSCLGEDDVASMRRCIRTDVDCADICSVTAHVLSRPSPSGDVWRLMVQACAAACRECAAECSTHDHPHCQNCAAACRECAEACQALLAVAD